MIASQPADQHFGQISPPADVLHEDGGACGTVQVVLDAAPTVPGQHGEAADVKHDLLPIVQP